MADIANLELEKYLLAGLLRNPETFADVDGMVDVNDFKNEFHGVIYGVIQKTLRSQEKLEVALIAEKINSLSLVFKDKISNPFDYLSNLRLIQIQSSGVKDIADELKLVTLRREIAQTAENISLSMLGKAQKMKREEIITLADCMYNEKISIWDSSAMMPQDMCADIDDVLLRLAKNPVEDIGLPGPHPLLNQMYGSLLRPGNISVICSRSGSGKTTFLNDFCFKVGEQTGVPTLHFDNGEMLLQELQMRMAASLSGVPYYLVETGRYAKDAETYKMVLNAAKRMKKQHFHYFNVAGKSVEQIITLLRRFYLARIGRGKPLTFCFDYIKSTSEKSEGNKQEYELIGKMVTKFKDFISSEVIIPMISAVQANRSGVTTNKSSDTVVDDESIVSGGDRTVFFASQAFILRKKTLDELTAENHRWGTHKLINIKARHLGKDVNRALNLVSVPNSKFRRSNYINLDIKNFKVEERKDLVAQVAELSKFQVPQFQKRDVGI